MRKILVFALSLALLLSACGSPAPAATATSTPAWFAYNFTDAATGQKFSIDSLKGKVVLVETMAQWCTNCKQQQTQVRDLRTKLGDQPDFVSIGLDIDLNETAGNLRTYVKQNNFNWLHAVATPSVAREISNLYGSEFLNPPSTPILIVDRQGVAHPLPFGIKSADDLYKAIQPLLNAS